MAFAMTVETPAGADRQFMSDTLLRDASVQEPQLELIRPHSFNALDGEKVYASLLRNRGLWRVCLLRSPVQRHFSGF